MIHVFVTRPAWPCTVWVTVEVSTDARTTVTGAGTAVGPTTMTTVPSPGITVCAEEGTSVNILETVIPTGESVGEGPTTTGPSPGTVTVSGHSAPEGPIVYNTVGNAAAVV
jgi:hypothetical protein